MFCPVCKAEYRSGFKTCSDCGVDLVDRLPADQSIFSEGAPRDSEGRELLWSGLSAHLGDLIAEALDAAHIAYRATDKEFGILPTFSQNAKMIWIEPRDSGAARSILKEVLANNLADQFQDDVTRDESSRPDPFGLNRKSYIREPQQPVEYPEDELPAHDTPGEPVPDDIVEDFYPEDATTEVWAGDDADMAENLKACLNGVGIGCVVSDDGEGGKARVLVLPASEARAREIVREIVEGVPPE